MLQLQKRALFDDATFVQKMLVRTTFVQTTLVRIDVS